MIDAIIQKGAARASFCGGIIINIKLKQNSIKKTNRKFEKKKSRKKISNTKIIHFKMGNCKKCHTII